MAKFNPIYSITNSIANNLLEIERVKEWIKTLPINPKLLSSLRETAKTAAPVMLVVATATVFGRVLTMMQTPQFVAELIVDNFSSKVVVLIIVNLFLLFVGMIMDTTPAILILTPIFLPIMAGLGVDPIHFGVIMVVNLAIGFVTPPIGVNLFVASSMTKIPILRIAKHAVPFIIAFLLALVFITFIPELSLALI